MNAAPNNDYDRLNPHELQKLRLWIPYAGPVGETSKEHPTLAELAEVSQVDTALLRTQLKVIRAEFARQAVSREPRRRARLTVNRRLLFAAVVALSATGYFAYLRQVDPHGLTAADRRKLLREILSRRDLTVYPVEKTVDLGADSPPFGFPLELDGRYVIVSAQPPSNAPILSESETRVQLSRSLEALVRAAQKVVQETPVPTENTELLPVGVRASTAEAYRGVTPASLSGKVESPLGLNEFVLGRGDMIVDFSRRITSPPTDPMALSDWRTDISRIANDIYATQFRRH